MKEQILLDKLLFDRYFNNKELDIVIPNFYDVLTNKELFLKNISKSTLKKINNIPANLDIIYSKTIQLLANLFLKNIERIVNNIFDNIKQSNILVHTLRTPSEYMYDIKKQVNVSAFFIDIRNLEKFLINKIRYCKLNSKCLYLYTISIVTVNIDDKQIVKCVLRSTITD